MKKKNILALIFGYLALTSGSIWFGAYAARLLPTYTMFEETEPTLKNFLNGSNIPAVAEVLSPIIILTLICYLLMAITFTVFLITTDLKLKENGWLFIIAGIIFITLPFEVVQIIQDYKLFVLFYSGDYGSTKIVPLITDWLTKLSSFPVILILSYLSIPYLLIFKPFTLKLKNEN